MTSDFALSLSHDTVRLLRRTPDGWETLGDADPSAEDASEQLALLRHSALPDKADTLECTVVLPDDLIRYLEAPAGGEDDDTRTLAEQALTGATPYAVDELVWDAIVADDRLCIAAVARETIEEAREFARSHHFEPTGFSAAAEHQSFPGAPDFGNGLPGSKSSSPGNVVAEVEAPETESASAPSDLITAAAQDDNIFGEVSTNAGPVAGYGLSEDPSPYEPPAPVRPSLAAATSLRPGRHVDLAAMQQSTKRDRGAVAAGFLAAVVVVSVISSALWATGIIGNGGIAAWLNRPSEIPPDAQFASPPQPAEPLAPVASASLPATPLTGTDAAILEALSVPVSPGPQPETPGHLAEERTAYAVTGIWPFAPVVPEPPALIDLNDLYSTSIDPVQISFDAIALPAVPATSPDQTLTAPASPAPAGTRFALDDQGLVRPSADGTVNPDGIRVFAGPPPARPPAERPVAAEPGEDPVLRALLAGIRPPPRPEDLIEQTERATLSGLTRAELAAFRPQLRPRSVQDEATARTASLVPPDSTNTSLLEDQASEDGSDAGNIIPVSLRPSNRPSDFGLTVARAQQQKAQQPEATVTTASVAPRAVVPSIPSSASASREATQKNAINLRRVNLIGVYGKPSDRRALIRLGNGRYQKVKVGDRLDGGRVSSIGDAELRYQKSGRNIILKMPRG